MVNKKDIKIAKQFLTLLKIVLHLVPSHERMKFLEIIKEYMKKEK